MNSVASFTTLRKQYDNAMIIDNRQELRPRNNVILTCEHASNALPEGYKWTESDKYFANEHWGSDIGSLNLSKLVSEELNLLLVHSRWSRLLCDVNRSPVSDTIFRTSGDGKTIELNQDLSFEEEQNRLQKFHVGYFQAFRDVSVALSPDYIISVHSFTPNYEGSIRKEEVGVLTSHSDELGDKFLKEFQDRGYKAFLNQPWSGKKGLNYAVDTLLTAKYPVKREAIVLEFRNDMLSDPDTLQRISRDLQEAMMKICLS